MSEENKWRQASSKKVASLLQRVLGYSTVQIAVQGVNAVTGFMLVRVLAKEDYAWFTIANSLMATVNILGDSGLGSATSVVGGQLVTNTSAFAVLEATIRRLRLRFVAISCALVLPLGWLLLERQQVPVIVETGLLGLVAMSAIPAAEVALLVSVRRLRNDLSDLMKADVVGCVLRLTLVFSFIWSGGGVFMALAATLVATLAQMAILAQSKGDMPSIRGGGTVDLHAAVMRVVKGMFPLAVFQCVQGHLSTWVVAIFSETHAVAEIGAVSRLAFIFSCLAIPMVHLGGPAIARCSSSGKLRHLVSLSVGGTIIVSSLAVLGIAAAASKVLWVFGANYAGLERELTWYAASQGVGLISAVLWTIVMSKGWLAGAWMHIPLTITIQVCAVGVLDLRKIVDVILFSSVSSVAGIAIWTWMIWKGLNKQGEKELRVAE